METSTTIGLDVGDKYCQLYVVDNVTGEEQEQAKVPTKPAPMQRWFEVRPRARVVLEVGGHASWISRLLSELGHEVLVADARKARLLMGGEQKDDQLDAELLARFGRADPKLLRPVKLRGRQTQSELTVIRSRDQLVSVRTSLINHVRGAVKAEGCRMPRSSSASFHRWAEAVPQPLLESLEPVMKLIEQTTTQIKALDATIERLCEEHPATEGLRQISGVGPITALCDVLTIEDPGRFAKSRQVGPYLGLVPRRHQSGDKDPELRITKAGDHLLRRLLLQCAHYILGPHGPDSDLRRWGLAHAQGGKVAKKRACVAVARRLAVLMHRLWVSGQDYDPLYVAKRLQPAAA